jgi:hypothetical protein
MDVLPHFEKTECGCFFPSFDLIKTEMRSDIIMSREEKGCITAVLKRNILALIARIETAWIASGPLSHEIFQTATSTVSLSCFHIPCLIAPRK